MRISRKRLLKYASYASTLLIIGILIFAVVNLVQGVQPFYAVSDNPSSMSPAMNCGDVAMVYKVSFNDLRVGDIIVFKDPRGSSQTIVHRVVAIETENNSRYLVTKGDNDVTNPTNDPWKVTEQTYLSKTLLVVPLIGYISPALWGSSSPMIFAIIIAAVLLIYFLYPKREKKGSEKSEEPGKGGA